MEKSRVDTDGESINDAKANAKVGAEVGDMIGGVDGRCLGGVVAFVDAEKTNQSATQLVNWMDFSKSSLVDVDQIGFLS